MQAELTRETDPAVGKSLSIIQYIFRNYHPRNFTVRLWDGTTWDAEQSVPVQFTLIMKNRWTLKKILSNPCDLTIGEAYIYDDIDIEGDMESAIAMLAYFINRRPGTAEKTRLGIDMVSLPSGDGHDGHKPGLKPKSALHSKGRDRQAVSYHYDVSNDFYSLWLDRRMVYSCAYFETGEDDLDAAQEHKLDYICRKLRLEPGDRLLDIGCGWGALVMHAAGRFGANALGITLSRHQAELANRRIRDAGLEKSCRVEQLDYRELKEPASFDKLASIGMFEHVGKSKMDVYFNNSWKLLRPGGLFLNHAISCPPEVALEKGDTFSTRYVFPDGELLPIGKILNAAENAGFEVRDVESLREHYPPTLLKWAHRLEARREEAVRITDEVTYRIWRLYMHGSAYGFKVGRYNVYQTLLVKADCGKSGLPLTRADWYR